MKGFEPSNDPKDPTELPCKVRIRCPDGNVQNASVVRSDKVEILNILRVIIALESETMEAMPPGKPGIARVFITCYDAKLGRSAFYVADAIL